MTIKQKLKEIPQEVIVGLRGVKDHHKLMALAYRRSNSSRISCRVIAEEFGLNRNTVERAIRKVYHKALKKHKMEMSQRLWKAERLEQERGEL